MRAGCFSLKLILLFSYATSLLFQCPVQARFNIHVYFYNLKGIITDIQGGGGGVVLKQLNYTISMLSILFRSVDRIVKIIKMIHVGVKKSSRTFWIFSGNISSPNSQDILPGPLKSTNIYYFGYFIYMCLNKVSKKSLF